MVTLTKDAVTQYDIATNPQATTIYRTMDVREAEAQVRCAVELGDLIQEHDTTDRAGHPLRVVLHICVDIDNDRDPDMGGIYEFPRPVTLPSTERRAAPDFGSPEWFTAHETAYNDPRVTSIDTSADYVGEHSHDNGHTWQPRPTSGPWDHVYGHVVLADVVHALLTGYDAVADGATRIIRGEGGRLTRWTLCDDFAYPAT